MGLARRRGVMGRSWPIGRVLVLTIAAAAAVMATRTTGVVQLQAQARPPAARPGDWRWAGSDSGASRYSPLNQISADNVSKVNVAWRWSARNQGPRPALQLQVRPLVIDGIMYSTAGDQRNVVAIDAETGETAVDLAPG